MQFSPSLTKAAKDRNLTYCSRQSSFRKNIASFIETNPSICCLLLYLEMSVFVYSRLFLVCSRLLLACYSSELVCTRLLLSVTRGYF
jgi:hypothetical protein